jgi:hypothetical protein
MWETDEIVFGSFQKTSSMDAVLETKISELTDRGRKNRVKATNFEDGMRVMSHTNNGVVIPGQLPTSGTKGTVVSVKTATGDVTSLDGEVFVQFDGRNKIDRIPANFLRVASMKVANINDHFIVLSGPNLSASFLSQAGGESTLVHKSTKDLWSMKVSEDGSFDVERLFDDNGDPLKI